MSSSPQDDLRQEIQARLSEIPAAPWVVEMLDHYRRAGVYRPRDLRRLLGDPHRSVEVGPNVSLASHFARSRGG